VDALSIAWGGENIWLFPPTHLVGSAVAHLRACGASATLICPTAPWAQWWPALRLGTGWAWDVLRVDPPGSPRRRSGYFHARPPPLRGGHVIAIRFCRS
jgi:hypothetical protein